MGHKLMNTKSRPKGVPNRNSQALCQGILKMKTKTSASDSKSDAAKKLGGQPENDRDARDAGVPSATSTSKPKKPGNSAGRVKAQL